VDLTPFGQAEQVQTQRFVWFTTISYADSAAGLVMRAVLDSVQVELVPGPLVAQASLDSARGVQVEGFLDGWGRVASLTRRGAGTFVTVFENQLRLLHPRRKPDARAGERWTDTLNLDSQTGEGSATVTTVTTFTLAGAETHAGHPGTRLDASFTSTTVGKLQTQAGPADLTATGNGQTTYHVGSDGRLLGSTTTSTAQGSIDLTMAPAPIGLKTTTTITTTLVP
jgi:hypothetical protein